MNPEQNMQDALLAEILGFDPKTGQRITEGVKESSTDFDIVEQTVGFSLTTRERIFGPQQNEIPRPIRDEFERRMFGPTKQLYATRLESAKLFKSEDRLSNVIRSYHHYNPSIPATKQSFPVKKMLTFEKLTTPNPTRFSGHRLKSIGIYDYEDDNSIDITFNKDGATTIFLQVDGGTDIRIVYHNGSLALCTRHEDGKNTLIYDFPRAESHEITTKYSRIVLPHYPKAINYEAEILNNPKLLSNPFESSTIEDNNWLEKSQNILSVFGIAIKT